ncbi:MAG: hypothetical protein ACKPKO_55805, partial [Candidatus Fonsibacter sp.]
QILSSRQLGCGDPSAGSFYGSNEILGIALLRRGAEVRAMRCLDYVLNIVDGSNVLCFRCGVVVSRTPWSLPSAARANSLVTMSAVPLAIWLIFAAMSLRVSRRNALHNHSAVIRYNKN